MLLLPANSLQSNPQAGIAHAEKTVETGVFGPQFSERFQPCEFAPLPAWSEYL